MAFLAPLAAAATPYLGAAATTAGSYLASKLGEKFAPAALKIGGKLANMTFSSKGRKSAKEWLKSRTSKKGIYKLLSRDLPKALKFASEEGLVPEKYKNVVDTGLNVVDAMQGGNNDVEKWVKNQLMVMDENILQNSKFYRWMNENFPNSDHDIAHWRKFAEVDPKEATRDVTEYFYIPEIQGNNPPEYLEALRKALEKHYNVKIHDKGSKGAPSETMNEILGKFYENNDEKPNQYGYNI